MVLGIPDSWDKVASASNKDINYYAASWSPCSQFIATVAGNFIEIRSQLTLELSTALQPTKADLKLMGELAYSPDGCFLACSSDGFILIWDIQTGGVVREIECDSHPISLTWSLDGRAVGVIGWNKAQQVITYDVASGRTLFTGRLYSGGNLTHLWAYKETFLVITTLWGVYCEVATFNIFEVKDTLVNILSLMTDSDPNISFSPITCRIAFSDYRVLRIFENWNSTCILEETGRLSNHDFSSDGSLFAAYKDSNIHIWKYDSSRFSPWKQFPFVANFLPLQFSPNLSSIMQRLNSVLDVWRLHDLPHFSTTPHSPLQAGLTRSGQIVQASGNFITILNPHSQPSRVPVVDAGGKIETFVLTGNVLLVTAKMEVIAWLVPPAGFAADDPLGHRLADRTDALWTIQASSTPTVGVAGKFGFIEGDSGSRRFYHTETGEVFDLDFSTTYLHKKSLEHHPHGSDYLHFHDLPRPNALPGGGWQTSREGWVRDSEGRSRLWLPVDWRWGWDAKDWRDDSMTQFSIIGEKVVIVKF